MTNETDWTLEDAKLAVRKVRQEILARVDEEILCPMARAALSEAVSFLSLAQSALERAELHQTQSIAEFQGFRGR